MLLVENHQEVACCHCSDCVEGITAKGAPCSHQSIATAGWRGPNPFKRWFGSILPALAKHCGITVSEMDTPAAVKRSEPSQRLDGSKSLILKESERRWAKKGHVAFRNLIKTWDVAHHAMSTHQLKGTMPCLFLSPAFSLARSPSPTLCDMQVHLAHYTPFTTTPITHRYSWSTLHNFLLCCLPGSLFILLAIFLSFMLAPLPESEKNCSLRKG